MSEFNTQEIVLPITEQDFREGKSFALNLHEFKYDGISSMLRKLPGNALAAGESFRSDSLTFVVGGPSVSAVGEASVTCWVHAGNVDFKKDKFYYYSYNQLEPVCGYLKFQP
jgi:hypothetical protein